MPGLCERKGDADGQPIAQAQRRGRSTRDREVSLLACRLLPLDLPELKKYDELLLLEALVQLP
jgi:hypothetical protein